MTTQKDTVASGVNVLPLLAGLIALCLAGAAALTVLTRETAPITAPNEQLSLVAQRIPYEAQNALRGESSAFDALAKSVARLKTLPCPTQAPDSVTRPPPQRPRPPRRGTQRRPPRAPRRAQAPPRGPS